MPERRHSVRRGLTMAKGLGILVTLLVVSILGTLWLEQTLPRYAGLELAVIAVMVVMGLLLFFGAALGSGWVWSLAVLFFAGSAANLALVYSVAQEAFLEFSLLLGWVVLSLTYAMTRASTQAQTTLERYDTNTPVPLENIMPVPRTSARQAVKRMVRKARRRKK